MVAGCATSLTFTDPVASFFAVLRIPSAGRLFIASIVLFIKDCEAWTESPVWEAYLPWAPEIQRKFGTQ